MVNILRTTLKYFAVMGTLTLGLIALAYFFGPVGFLLGVVFCFCLLAATLIEDSKVGNTDV
jgi:hypothetical protein